jgi:hypothetical protein
MEEVVAHLFSLIFIHPRLIIWFPRLLASSPTPNLEDQGIPLVWPLPLDLPGMGDSISSYATAGIALRISGVLKPHHHDKVETPSVGILS